MADDLTPTVVPGGSRGDLTPTARPGGGDVTNSASFRRFVTLHHQSRVTAGAEREQFLRELRSARQEFMREAGVTEQQADEMAHQAMQSGAPFGGGASGAAGRLAGNAFGAAMGVFDPVQLAGDATRTFPAMLAEVQHERDVGDVGRRDLNAARTGTASGSPASTPWQAAGELVQAAGRTAEHLLGDGGWVAYLPSITWEGKGLGVTPYEAGRAVRGTEFNQRFGVSDRLRDGYGLDDEGLEWAGLATEVLLDPWLAADWFFMGGRAFAATGKVSGSQRVTNVGRGMERIGTDIYEALSPLGFGRQVARGADAASGGAAGAAIAAVDKGINALLDLPMPQVFQRRGQDWARGVQGVPDEVMRPQLRDLLFQGGTPAYVSRPKTRPASMTGDPTYGQSIGELAYNTQRYMNNIALRGAERIQDSLTSGLTRGVNVRLPGMKVNIVSARVVRPEHEAYSRSLGRLVSEFTDAHGMTKAMPDSWRKRVHDVADAFGMSHQDAMQRFTSATTETRRLVMEAGYVASGYEDYARAMRRAGAQLDADFSPEDLRRAYERHVGGVDIQTMEAADAFSLTPAARTGSRAPDASDLDRAREARRLFQNDPELVTAYEGLVADELKALGRADLAQLNPRQYLEGFREGYLRRMFSGVEEPQAAIRALEDRRIVVIQDMDAPDLAARLSAEFGGQASKRVERFLDAMTPDLPRGFQAPEGQAVARSATLQTDDLALLLSRETGQPVTPQQVADVIYRNNPDAQYLRETIDTITNYTAAQSGGSGTGGAPFARTPAAYQARQDLSPEQLMARLQLFDPVQQAAEVGIRAGRVARSSTMLGQAHDELQQLGLMLSRDDLVRQAASGVNSTQAKDALRALTAGENAAARRAAGLDAEVPGMFSFLNGNNEKYVIVPNDKARWGPLANQAIPEDFARLTVHAMQYSRHDSGAYGRLLNMWRRGLLAPLSTSLRNVGGNFILMQQAGASMADMVQNLPRAQRLRRYFLEHGRLPKEFRGLEPHFTFVSESTATAQVTRGLEQRLESLLGRKKVGTGERLLNLLDDVTDVATHTPGPGVGGFLGLFRYGEEVTRVSSFLTQYDALARAGVQQGEAMKRAAHFAANAGYNYGALPLFPDALKRTGLSAFPQFTWFSVGRTTRVMAERPSVPLRVEYARQAANMSMAGADPEEHERLTSNTAEWLRHTFPLAFPMPDEDGNYFVSNLDYWLPQGSNVADLLMEPLGAGWLSPLVDTYYAFRDETGMGPRGARYGQRVFDPAKDSVGRAQDAAAYLGSQLILPGIFRTGRQVSEAFEHNVGSPSKEWRESTPSFLHGGVGTFLEGIATGDALNREWYTQNREVMSRLMMHQGRYYNSEWLQLAGRLVGLGSQRVDVVGHISHQQREREIRRSYQSALSSLTSQIERAAISGDFVEAQELTRRQHDLRTEMMEEITALKRSQRPRR